MLSDLNQFDLDKIHPEKLHSKQGCTQLQINANSNWGYLYQFADPKSKQAAPSSFWCGLKLLQSATENNWYSEE